MKLLVVQDKLKPTADEQLLRLPSALRSRISAIDVLIRCDDRMQTSTLNDYGLVILCGSSASLVLDSSDWIIQERALIQYCLEHQIPCLGICFGAQHIASVLGASVRRMSEARNCFEEIAVDQLDGFSSLSSVPALFLHSDAIYNLACSGGTVLRDDGSVVMFQHAGHIWGIQPHFEMTLPLFDYFCSVGSCSVTEEQFRKITAMFAHFDQRMQQFADAFFARVFHIVQQRLSA